MKTFSVDCPDEEIRQSVVEWAELLAQERFAEALALFEKTTESFGFEWTADRLEEWVKNYGCDRAGYDDGVYHQPTSLFEQPDPDEYIRNAIKVDRVHLFGLDPAWYVGMVHYDDVPLDGKRSDLTARFHIKKVDADRLTLEFLDIHVM